MERLVPDAGRQLTATGKMRDVAAGRGEPVARRPGDVVFIEK
jgi:hypothetical protein